MLIFFFPYFFFFIFFVDLLPLLDYFVYIHIHCPLWGNETKGEIVLSRFLVKLEYDTSNAGFLPGFSSSCPCGVGYNEDLFG